MNTRSMYRVAALVAALVVVWAASSCSKKKSPIFIANQIPTVVITAAPIDTNATCTPDPVRSCYALTLDWVGHDPDGRVDHYLYAVDPPSVGDTAWTITTNNEIRIVLSARKLLPDAGNGHRIAEDPHVFVIKAIDNKQAAGPVTYRAFFSFTEAPTVAIENPRPNHLFTPIVPPSVKISWSGNDPDGVFTTKPVKYKFILLNPSSQFPIGIAASQPDSLRRYYAPTFFGWDSTSAESTTVQYTNLTPNQTYLFALVGFDEAGAYSPVFSLDINMLQFKVGFAGIQGPIITFFNEFFNYTYPTGSYCPCAQVEIFVELPAANAINMNWSATPSQGADINCYRWALDIQDVGDDTPRTGPDDLRHWSECLLNENTVRLGPFPAGEEHRLYVEARDNVGLKSLGIVRFISVQGSFDKEIGIVDDTRMTPDQIPRDSLCTRAPLGSWPTAAELDTFLYARGNTPWRCYPTGTVTPPGLFAGYPFDTLGTRVGRNDLTVRLAILGQFRHLIWMTDFDGAASFTSTGGDAVKPSTALRYMAAPGRVNTLGAYVKQGGKLWCSGGGIAYASHITWNDNTNDHPPGRTVFASSSGAHRELVPGRFMYDLAHWQSTIGSSKEVASAVKFIGRFSAGSDPNLAYTSFLGELPNALERKNQNGFDPPPPNRPNVSNFYQATVPLEYMYLENNIIENVAPNPVDTLIEASTLDTLYDAVGSTLTSAGTPHNILMTYYHGPSIPHGFLFSGFSLWGFKHDQTKRLIDFVIHRIWELPLPAPATRSAMPERAVSHPPARAAVVRPAAPGQAVPPWRRTPALFYGRPPVPATAPR